MASGFELDADLCLPLDESPVTVLFGPSGSGKTTLLRLLAGLDRPDDGAISFRDSAWYDGGRSICLPPQQRRAVFLFQDCALFPHLTVTANVEYAARGETARRLMDVFGLAELADRFPRALSGGQQQRVAVARALAAEPALLLLDEPLSSLDAAARGRMRQELRRMLLNGGVPSLVVTHDRMEAVALGDWMAVLVDGRIRQAEDIHESAGGFAARGIRHVGGHGQVREERTILKQEHGAALLGRQTNAERSVVPRAIAEGDGAVVGAVETGQ